MKDFQKTIEELFNEIETRLSSKLIMQGFQMHQQISTAEDFGSRYAEWRNETEKYSLRLVWNGKENCFIVEESPFTEGNVPTSWADIVIVSIEKIRLSDITYTSTIIEGIMNEVK